MKDLSHPAWIKAKGMDLVRGPVNPSTNEPCGLLIEGFDSPPMVMTPYNPPYYAGQIEAAGFAKAKDLYAFQDDCHPSAFGHKLAGDTTAALVAGLLP